MGVISDGEHSTPFSVHGGVVDKGEAEEWHLCDEYFSLFFIYVPESSTLQAEHLIAKTGDLHSPPSLH